LTIVFERDKGQVPLEEILRFPTPSQLDDWGIYRTIKREDTEKRYGMQQHYALEKKKTLAKENKDEWLRLRKFESSKMSATTRDISLAFKLFYRILE
jgi:hypothetical protein